MTSTTHTEWHNNDISNILKEACIVRRNIALAPAISFIATHFFVACSVCRLSSVVCHIRLNRSWIYIQFGRYRLHLRGPVTRCVRWASLIAWEGEILRGWSPQPKLAIAYLWFIWGQHPSAFPRFTELLRSLALGDKRAAVYCCWLQIPASKSLLDPGDVFILDMGLTIYQWNGSGASVFEKQKVKAA